ncbi:hypothetical protein N9Y17_04145 [Gammaproteobacteria bacterium]|nr:hypothetical protein [Gammaproteobacteria bacterium]
MKASTSNLNENTLLTPELYFEAHIRRFISERNQKTVTDFFEQIKDCPLSVLSPEIEKLMPMIQLRCGSEKLLDDVDFEDIDRLQQAILSLNDNRSKEKMVDIQKQYLNLVAHFMKNGLLDLTNDAWQAIYQKADSLIDDVSDELLKIFDLMVDEQKILALANHPSSPHELFFKQMIEKIDNQMITSYLFTPDKDLSSLSSIKVLLTYVKNPITADQWQILSDNLATSKGNMTDELSAIFSRIEGADQLAVLQHELPLDQQELNKALVHKVNGKLLVDSLLDPQTNELVREYKSTSDCMIAIDSHPFKDKSLPSWLLVLEYLLSTVTWFLIGYYIPVSHVVAACLWLIDMCLLSFTNVHYRCVASGIKWKIYILTLGVSIYFLSPAMTFIQLTYMLLPLALVFKVQKLIFPLFKHYVFNDYLTEFCQPVLPAGEKDTDIVESDSDDLSTDCLDSGGVRRPDESYTDQLLPSHADQEFTDQQEQADLEHATWLSLQQQ